MSNPYDRRVYESPSDETLERQAFDREWKAYQDGCAVLLWMTAIVFGIVTYAMGLWQ